MELKEYLAIFRRHANFFLGIVLVFLLMGIAAKIFQPVRYKAELVLNVTRLGQLETTDYRYDNFYRLQADELFADTVVRWLGTARIQNDIQEVAGSNLIALGAKRLSSQMIAVEIEANKASGVEKIAGATAQVVNQEAQKLNDWQKEKNWFAVVADEPMVSKSVWEWHKIIFISLALGLFIAFWSVIISHYFENGL